MKKSIYSILLLFMLSLGFANMGFAANPIPGVDIIVKKDPGGHSVAIVQTGKDGKFTAKLPEGQYELSISYSQIERVMSSDRTFKHGNAITLMLDNGAWDVMVNGKKSERKIAVNNTVTAIIISVPKGGATISGSLYYDSVSVRTAPAAKLKPNKL